MGSMKYAIKQLVERAIRDAVTEGAFPHITIPNFDVLTPDTDAHGHIATNVAMKLAPVVRQSPMNIANVLAPRLTTFGNQIFEKVEVAPPGCINFYYREDYLSGQVSLILKGKNTYWSTQTSEPEKIQIEFISANPTGPLTAANGRGGFFGDTLANVLATQGYKVDREYYMNDRGTQVNLLAESVARRYLQAHGVKVDFPDELYQGDYIKEIAKKIGREIESTNLEDVTKKVSSVALKTTTADIKRVTKTVMKIKYDKFFSEASLYRPKTKPNQVIARLRKAGLAYEKDGAIWMNTRKFGDDKDRVLVKSDGNYAYFLSDVLYMENRLKTRGYDRIVEVLGADHHGYVQRFKAAAQAINPKKRIDVPLVQMVRLVRSGKEVRMSKRKGQFITIESVINEIGLDAARYFFIASSLDSQMDLDLDLAKERSEKNPVYYVQYAHARMSGILRKAGKAKLPKSPQFTQPEEFALIRALMAAPQLLAEVSETYDVHRIPTYCIDLARVFHRFYDNNRVISEGKVYTDRLALVKATQIVLAGMLALMGINAPKKMSYADRN
jgi:arginyl-tRNA synthetase